MRHLLTAAALLASLVATDAVASTHRCQLSQDCFYCVPGQKTDDCSVNCDICVGIKCLDRSSAAALDELGERPEKRGETLAPLMRYAPEPLERVLGRGPGLAIRALWKWYESPITLKRDPLDLLGAVKLDGKAVEFSLSIRQQGPSQVYTLDLDGEPRITWQVRAADEENLEIELDVAAKGTRPGSAGVLRVPRQP